MPYAELHCHSNFSFLDGASHPEELAEEAARLGLEALALTDHDGFYGVVRFAEAAREVGLPTVFGAELSLGLTAPQNGAADPEGQHLVVLARDPAGYARLARVLSTAQMSGREGEPIYCSSPAEPAPKQDGGGVPTGRRQPPPAAERRTQPSTVYHLSQLAEANAGHWVVLTGCRKGTVPAALARDGPAAAARALADLVALFGPGNVFVELWDHGDPLDSARNDALAELAARAGVETVATNNVHYATPARRRLATALAAVRARRSLDELDGWLPAAATAHLRSGAEQVRRFRRYPGVVERAAELGRACAFDLTLVAPDLPPYPCPDGLDEMAYLRRLTETGAARRYGPGPASAAAAGPTSRSTTSSPSSSSSGSPATSSSCGTSSSSAGGPTSTARDAGRRPTRPSATPSASPTPTRCRSACCSSGSCHPSATVRPTSTSTSRATGARRSSSTSTTATGASTRPRWPTSSPTGPGRPCATWPRRSGRRPASRTPGPSRSTPGVR